MPDAREVKSFGDLAVDLDARQVFLHDRPIHLTRTEFELLSVFVNSPRRAFSRSQLIEMIWGGNWFGESHMVSVHISNLRRKIGDAHRVPPLIHTLHGVGYRFDGHPTQGSRPAVAELDGQAADTGVVSGGRALDGQQGAEAGGFAAVPITQSGLGARPTVAG